jgi:hypothetical protein
MSERVVNMPHGRYVRGFPSHRTGDQIGKLAESYRSLLSVADMGKARAAEIAKDENLTAAGKKAAMRDWFLANGLPTLTSAKASLQGAEAVAWGTRANMKRSAIDKTDVAAALLRQETRAWLRGMDPAQRTAVLVAPDLDPSIAQAVAEAPAPLSGVTQAQLDRIAGLTLASLNPEECERVEGIEEAALAVMDAQRMAALALGEAAGLSDFEVEEAMGGPTTRQKIEAALERGSMSSDRSGYQSPAA